MTRATLLILFGVLIGAAGTTALRAVNLGESKVELPKPNEPPSNACASVDFKQQTKRTDEVNFVGGSLNEAIAIPDESTSFPLEPSGSSEQMSQFDGENSTSGPVDQRPADSTNLPEKFRYLVDSQPVSKRRLTPHENHAFFNQDIRDESWAYTMEVGIREYLATNQNANGAIIEYVECRSRMCEIAGVVYPGGQDDFSEHLEVMRESGWWQLSNSHHSTGANVDGEYRFVSFIPRDNEDTLVRELESSICD